MIKLVTLLPLHSLKLAGPFGANRPLIFAKFKKVKDA